MCEGGLLQEKKERKNRKLSIFPKFGLLFLLAEALLTWTVGISVLEELLRLPGTRIYCGTSAWERKSALDGMAEINMHGQTFNILYT